MQQIGFGEQTEDGNGNATGSHGKDIAADRPEVVYTTCPSLDVAERIGRTLVEARLVACANILPAMRSVYAWQGEIETADEVVMILKTRSGQAEEVIARIEAEHPYETPAVLSWPVSGGAADYVSWICAQTRQKSDKS